MELPANTGEPPSHPSLRGVLLRLTARVLTRELATTAIATPYIAPLYSLTGLIALFQRYLKMYPVLLLLILVRR